MEYVNEDIGIRILNNDDLESSYCCVSSNSSQWIFDFGLYANDCLFDLAETNHQISISITKHYFAKYQEPYYFVEGRDAICCNIQSKLLELVNIAQQGIHRKIFMESHILFLVYLLAKNRDAHQTECDNCSILSKPTDREKMRIARKFILKNLSNTLSIPIIANHVGTNQCYLKKGFKEVFNQTIFEFIQENRMIKAKHLLIHEDLSITEISANVGYASLSSFSQAYKNYFGISPIEQRKTVFS